MSTAIAISFSLLTASACGSSAAAPPTRLEPGVWSGRGIQLTVTPEGGSIELSCAHATFDGPVRIDAERKLTGAGSYFEETPGPQREGASSGRPFRIDGSLDGDRLLLRLSLAEGASNYTLTRGSGTKLIKCR